MTRIAICRYCGEPITPARTPGFYRHVSIDDFYRRGRLPEPLGSDTPGDAEGDT